MVAALVGRARRILAVEKDASHYARGLLALRRLRRSCIFFLFFLFIIYSWKTSRLGNKVVEQGFLIFR